ncbi:MAG: fructosamine kinase family protein, partial [Planctomycetota bacterium]
GRLSGGCVGDVHRLRMPSGEDLVCKGAGGGAGGVGGGVGSSASLDIEGWMLGYLRPRSTLPVPEVVHCEPSLLVMRHVPNDGARSDAGDREAGRLLAELHGVGADAYGLERDTLIGPLAQSNTVADDWSRFFGERRLRPMAARAGGSLPGGTRGRIDRLCGRLDALIGEAGPPALVHGDLWSGNVLWDGGRVAAVIDPAVYHADAEVELAFIDLMGGFGRGFWEAYAEARPIRAGFWETRRDLYNLYPLLVHAALFDPPGGGGYASSVARTLDRLGF